MLVKRTLPFFSLSSRSLLELELGQLLGVGAGAIEAEQDPLFVTERIA
jgi:hypothetical protein